MAFVDMSRLQETVKEREDWCAVVHGSKRVKHNGVTKQQPPFQPNLFLPLPCSD